METLGYYTAGFLLCLIGEPQEYKNCLVYRSNFAFPTEQICQAAMVEQSKMLPVMFDMEAYELVNVKCIGWLETENLKKINSFKLSMN